MKKLILSLITLTLCSCTDSTSFISSKKECPKGNPYNYGGGRYAGYEWAQEKDVYSCSGNSSAFIQGCEEYLRQQNCKK